MNRMRYKVYDEEDKKERILSECVTDLGAVGDTKRVSIKNSKGILESHHFRVLEVLPDGK